VQKCKESEKIVVKARYQKWFGHKNTGRRVKETYRDAGKRGFIDRSGHYA
jgi:hypothetical protein